MAVNKVILLGNVGREPEIRTTTNGSELASFSLATTDVWKDKNTGERHDKTEWHNIVIYAPGLVNTVKNYVHKGSKIYLEGALQTRRWTDKNNVERYVTEVVLQSFSSTLQLLDAKNSGDSRPHDDMAGEPSIGKSSSDGFDADEGSGSVEEVDDDIPF